MSTAAVAQSDDPITSPRTWSASDPHVRKVLTLIKRGKIKTPEALVAWDRDHGQRLFDWNNESAAEWARFPTRTRRRLFPIHRAGCRAVFRGAR